MRIAINAWFLNQPGTGSGQYLQGLLLGLQHALPELAREHQFLLVAPLDHFDLDFPGLQVEFWPFSSPHRRSNLGKLLFEQVAFPRICRRWGGRPGSRSLLGLAAVARGAHGSDHP